MRINNNITAINSHRQYTINNGNIGKNVEKLSSGFRVNRAGDDAAGLAISEKMRSQIRGLNMASKNSQDAVSLVQTAEGGMQTIQDILQRMRELAVQSASDTNTDALDRKALDAEFQQLVNEIDQIADTTEFNELKLLNGGTAADGLTIQAGANAGQTLEIKISSMTSADLGSVGLNTLNIETRGAASASILALSSAINSVSMQRADLGAMQNRLEFKIQNLDNQAENIAAAESRIRDADMAKMMTEFTKTSILFQASTAMLAQANSLPQSVLQLIG
jgi:flagellin